MDIDFLRISTETKILKAATRANSVLVAEVMSRLCATCSARENVTMFTNCLLQFERNISVLLGLCCHSGHSVLLNLLLIVHGFIRTIQMHHYELSRLPFVWNEEAITMFSFGTLCPAFCMTISKQFAIQENFVVVAICILQIPFAYRPFSVSDVYMRYPCE